MRLDSSGKWESASARFARRRASPWPSSARTRRASSISSDSTCGRWRPAASPPRFRLSLISRGASTFRSLTCCEGYSRSLPRPSIDRSGALADTYSYSVKRRVLVIEDDPVVRRLIVESLTESGIDVLAAVDGTHALRTALAVPPSVVVLDLGLPEMEGADFVKEWRARNPAAEDVPIVVVSGRPDARQLGAVIGAKKVFGKPFVVEDLVSEVRGRLH
ncbi:MAG: response regulator [Chloroflexi bacterium]|nr:MAG: response regulator [Chloroflexota bacterium]